MKVLPYTYTTDEKKKLKRADRTQQHEICQILGRKISEMIDSPSQYQGTSYI